MFTQQWQYTKWVANFGYVLAAVMMLSPILAADKITPWVVYLLANLVWLTDSYKTKNWPWVWLAAFFCIWDVITAASRVYGVELLPIFAPLLTLLEKLP